VSVDEIDIVINTHLHWDHCYNNSLFKNARFVVQKKELEFAIAPIPTQENVYEAITLGMTPPWFATKQWEVVDGDEPICKGVSVIFTPGHTKGIQSVLVDTDEGPYLIAGDTVPLFENWRGKFSVPNGIHVDLETYFQTLNKIHRLNAVVLPGHDTAIFNSAVYPNKSRTATQNA
jgi:glyoxylase-like metal-dependent hydrolase (beta-lactamase superfamily II)